MEDSGISWESGNMKEEEVFGGRSKRKSCDRRKNKSNTKGGIGEANDGKPAGGKLQQALRVSLSDCGQQ